MNLIKNQKLKNSLISGISISVVLNIVLAILYGVTDNERLQLKEQNKFYLNTIYSQQKQLSLCSTVQPNKNCGYYKFGNQIIQIEGEQVEGGQEVQNKLYLNKDNKQIYLETDNQPQQQIYPLSNTIYTTVNGTTYQIDSKGDNFQWTTSLTANKTIDLLQNGTVQIDGKDTSTEVCNTDLPQEIYLPNGNDYYTLNSTNFVKDAPSGASQGMLEASYNTELVLQLGSNQIYPLGDSVYVKDNKFTTNSAVGGATIKVTNNGAITYDEEQIYPLSNTIYTTVNGTTYQIDSKGDNFQWAKLTANKTIDLLQNGTVQIDGKDASTEVCNTDLPQEIYLPNGDNYYTLNSTNFVKDTPSGASQGTLEASYNTELVLQLNNRQIYPTNSIAFKIEFNKTVTDNNTNKEVNQTITRYYQMEGPADAVVTGNIPTADNNTNNTEYSKIELSKTNTLTLNGHYGQKDYDGIILNNINIKDSNYGIYIQNTKINTISSGIYIGPLSSIFGENIGVEIKGTIYSSDTGISIQGANIGVNYINSTDLDKNSQISKTAIQIYNSKIFGSNQSIFFESNNIGYNFSYNDSDNKEVNKITNNSIVFTENNNLKANNTNIQFINRYSSEDLLISLLNSNNLNINMSGVRLMSSNSKYSSSDSTTHIILPFSDNFINNTYTVCLMSQTESPTSALECWVQQPNELKYKLEFNDSSNKTITRYYHMMGPSNKIVTGNIPTQDNNTNNIEYSKIELSDLNKLTLKGHYGQKDYDAVVLQDVVINDVINGIKIYNSSINDCIYGINIYDDVIIVGTTSGIQIDGQIGDSSISNNGIYLTELSRLFGKYQGLNISGQIYSPVTGINIQDANIGVNYINSTDLDKNTQISETGISIYISHIYGYNNSILFQYSNIGYNFSYNDSNGKEVNKITNNSIAFVSQNILKANTNNILFYTADFLNQLFSNNINIDLDYTQLISSNSSQSSNNRTTHIVLSSVYDHFANNTYTKCIVSYKKNPNSSECLVQDQQ